MASRKKADICIIGGGISGLALAALLEQTGRDYILIESQAELGGLLRGQNEGDLWLDYGLKSIPVGKELSENALIKLNQMLDLNLGLETWSDLPQTLTSSGTGAFMGFGEAKNRFLVEELSYYTQAPRLMVAGGWHILVEKLMALIPEDRIMKQTFVTKINTQDDLITSITLNGETQFTAREFVYTLSPLLLRDLLPIGSVTPKTLQRVARTKPLTAVSLDIVTSKKVTEAKNLFVFEEPSKEKNGDPFFVIGQFISNVDPLRHQKHFSTWMTFVDLESLEDDENASKTIRTMRKMIKKAFPALINDSNWERLLVIPAAIGQFEQMSLESNLTLPGLSNLWIAGGKTPGANRNISKAIDSAIEMSTTLTPHELTTSASVEVSPAP